MSGNRMARMRFLAIGHRLTPQRSYWPQECAWGGGARARSMAFSVRWSARGTRRDGQTPYHTQGTPSTGTVRGNADTLLDWRRCRNYRRNHRGYSSSVRRHEARKRTAGTRCLAAALRARRTRPRESDQSWCAVVKQLRSGSPNAASRIQVARTSGGRKLATHRAGPRQTLLAGWEPASSDGSRCLSRLPAAPRPLD
jgi:hypothetical protein